MMAFHSSSLFIVFEDAVVVKGVKAGAKGVKWYKGNSKL